MSAAQCQALSCSVLLFTQDEDDEDDEDEDEDEPPQLVKPKQSPKQSPKQAPKQSPLGPKRDELPRVTPERKPSLESPGQGPADDTYFVRDAGTQTPFSFPPNVVVVANGGQLTTHRI